LYAVGFVQRRDQQQRSMTLASNGKKGLIEVMGEFEDPSKKSAFRDWASCARRSMTRIDLLGDCEISSSYGRNLPTTVRIEWHVAIVRKGPNVHGLIRSAARWEPTDNCWRNGPDQGVRALTIPRSR
jgi:hypothetical protein